GDTFIGGLGSDAVSYEFASEGLVINLLGSADYITSGAAVGDTFKSIERVVGSAYADTIVADNSGGTLDGGEGDDMLIGGTGGDTFIGGAGFDTVSYENASQYIKIDYKQARLVGSGGAGGDYFDSIEHLIGTSYADKITIFDYSGDLTFIGGEGNDEVWSGRGNDVINGGDGNDHISGRDGDDVLKGGDGDDDLRGNNGNDVVYGGDGNDIIYGGHGDDRLEGGNGDDRLEGRFGSDVLIGGAGTDTAAYRHAPEGLVISLRAMNDSDDNAVNYISTGVAQGDVFESIERVEGSYYADTIVADNSGMTLDGDTGDDLLVGGAGGDTFIGGLGSDAASYELASEGLVINLLGSADYITSGEAVGDTFNSIERVVGSAYADTIVASSYLITLDGGDGDDLLVAGANASSFIGGSGTDAVSYENSSQYINIEYSSQDNRFIGSAAAGGDYFDSIEQFIGTSYADWITIQDYAGDVTISGGEGNDIISGGHGDDHLEGGGGDDTLVGGTGGDAFVGGAGTDTASYASSTQGLVISLQTVSDDSEVHALSFSSNGDAEGDVFEGIEHIIGSDYADTIVADDSGMILDGGDGDDLLVGGAGGDAFIGGLGSDEASYELASEGITITLQDDLDDYVASGGATGDTFDSIERFVGSHYSDYLRGNAFANYFDGGDGDDLLVGGTNADVLIGGAGADELRGGSGFDTASYATATEGAVITMLEGTDYVATGDAAGDTFDSIERIVGSAYGDTLVADNSGMTLDGEGSDDLLVGGTGADHLTGGEGDDVLNGGAGADQLIGGAGTDTVSYDSATEGMVLNLKVGSDYVSSGDAVGDSFEDIERFVGSRHNDTLVAANSGSSLDGNDGEDVLIGGEGDDVLDGGEGVDYLTGGEGDDVLDGGEGADVIHGGAGTDTLSYASLSHGVTIVVSYGSSDEPLLYAQGSAEFLADTFTGIERYAGSAFDDVFHASYAYAVSGHFDGLAGNDTYYGYYGRDVFMAGEGADHHDGGVGQDTIDFSDSGAITIDLVNTGASTGHAIGDTYTNMEVFVLGDENDKVVLSDDSSIFYITAGDGHDELHGRNDKLDKFRGGNGDDILYGYGGLDNLYGDSGNDTIYGGEGNDIIRGGYDNDTLYGEGGNDSIRGEWGSDTIYGGAGDDVLSGEGGNDVIYTGEGNDRVYGHSGHDTIYADGGRNDVWGGSGNDKFHISSTNNDALGGSGNDTFYISGQSNTIDGNSGIDTVSFKYASSSIQIDLEGDASSYGGSARHNVFENTEILHASDHDDDLRGDSGKQQLWGLAGNDYLAGRGGNDSLIGGEGDDELDGGSGNDFLMGKEGDDLIIGGGGTDTVLFDDDISSYRVRWATSDDSDLVLRNQLVFDDSQGNNLDGTDTLSEVEVIDFLDYSLDALGLHNVLAENIGWSGNTNWNDASFDLNAAEDNAWVDVYGLFVQNPGLMV
nr:hypothetical protein [Alphaproteobacteria bacterium]